jgi:hypothetical protein
MPPYETFDVDLREGQARKMRSGTRLAWGRLLLPHDQSPKPSDLKVTKSQSSRLLAQEKLTADATY